MNLVEILLLFFPLAAVISFFCSLLRRPKLSDVFPATLRMFLYMSGTILAICAVLHLLMEWFLAH